MAEQEKKKITPKRPGAEEDVPLSRVTDRAEEERKSLGRKNLGRKNLGRKNLGRKNLGRKTV